MIPRAPIGRRHALLLLAAAPAACASPNPALYTLAVVPGRVRTGAPHAVALRSVALARYLERSQIVRSSDGYRLDILGNDWWGEPLDSMLGRVLVQDLTQRLPGATVFAESGAIAATPDATVAINVQRLDQARSGDVVLMAQVGVMRRASATRDVNLAVTPAGAGVSDLVAAMSVATGQLADVVAGMLTGS
jgi:uncharacterized lipoprotein YmbA